MTNSNNSQDDIELERECITCGGSGGSRNLETGHWRWCGACNGSGYTTTKLGEKIVALMRHNFLPMLDEAQAQ